MSDQPERQYAEDGKWIGRCECGRQEHRPEESHLGWYDWANHFWRRGPFICPEANCGSYCDAEGHATPGTLVLDRMVRSLAGQLLDWKQHLGVPTTLMMLLWKEQQKARATLAAREGVTP